MTTTSELVTSQLYSDLKTIILRTPACADGSNGLPCASCLAQAIATALNDPTGSPLEAVAGDIPIFSPKDVQSLINAAVSIDRQECEHESCTRNSNVVLIPV